MPGQSIAPISGEAGRRLAFAYNDMVARGVHRASVRLNLPWANVHVHFDGRVTTKDQGIRVVALELAMDRALYAMAQQEDAG